MHHVLEVDSIGWVNVEFGHFLVQLFQRRERSPQQAFLVGYPGKKAPFLSSDMKTNKQTSICSARSACRPRCWTRSPVFRRSAIQQSPCWMRRYHPARSPCAPAGHPSRRLVCRTRVCQRGWDGSVDEKIRKGFSTHWTSFNMSLYESAMTVRYRSSTAAISSGWMKRWKNGKIIF